MYAHPIAVKKWAKAMKPDATAAQIEQARIMRAARSSKRDFLSRQQTLFSETASPARRTNPLPSGKRRQSSTGIF